MNVPRRVGEVRVSATAMLSSSAQTTQVDPDGAVRLLARRAGTTTEPPDAGGVDEVGRILARRAAAPDELARTPIDRATEQVTVPDDGEDVARILRRRTVSPAAADAPPESGDVGRLLRRRRSPADPEQES